MKKSQNLVKTSNEEIIRQCFEVFDQDENGLITQNEFVVSLFLTILALNRTILKNKKIFLVCRKRNWRIFAKFSRIYF